MALIVQKFGGTSVAGTDRIKEVAKIILAEIQKNNKVIVVVSAMAGVTNSLINMCSEVSVLGNKTHMREYDALLSSGEIVTSALLALELQNNGFEAVSLQGWQIPIETNKDHSDALVDRIRHEKLGMLLDDNVIPVIAGFQGVSSDGRVTTLGKGGSDTTAALVAAATGADRCDIYTDVEGVYSADPRVVHNATKIDVMSHEEMMEMSSSGAKVLHPRAALAALRYNFDLRVLTSFSQVPGTLITSKMIKMENRKITAITSNKNLLGIDIKHEGIALKDLSRHFLNSCLKIERMQSHNDYYTSFLANLSDKNKFEPVLTDLKNQKLISDFNLITNISNVTAIGYGIKNDSTLAWKIVELLESKGIKIKSIDSTEVKISILLDDQDTEKAIKILHNFTKIV
jgi:aspartate kinase